MKVSGGHPRHRRGHPAADPADRFAAAAEAWRSGRGDEALEICEALLPGARSPNLLAAAHNLGAVILAERRCLFSARDHIERAVRANPNDIRLLSHAARIHEATGRYDRASEHLRAACGISPESVPLRYGLARLRRFGEDLDEAETLARECLKDDPGFVEAGVLLSEIAFDRQDDDGVLRALGDVIAREPDHVRAWALLAEAGAPNGSAPRVEAALRRLSAPDREAETRATALFARAKLAMREGRSGDGLALLREANALRARETPFDVDRWERQIQSAGAGPGPADTAFAGDDDSGEDLVFVVGMPRSGTTLCEQILSAAPDVYGAGERTAMEYLQAELAHGRFTPAQARQAYRSSLPAGCTGSPRIVDKAPRNFERLQLVLRLFPAARVIWMVRHPLDTVLSCFMQDFGPGQSFSNRLEHAGRVYAGHAGLLRDAVRGQPERIEVVEYPDLVTRLSETAARLARFVGIPFHEAMLHPERNRRRARTASSEQVREPVHRRSLDRWMTYADELAGVREYLESEQLLAADGASRLREFVATASRPERADHR